MSLAAGIGAGASIFGAMMQNNANKQLQADANSANERIAAENRQWQEMMSNTAHQREVSDLKKAGLNPILSATGGSGASTPSGNAPTMGAAKMEDVLGKGVSSAMAAANLEADLAQKHSATALNEAAIQTAATQQALNASNAALSQEQALNTMSATRRGYTEEEAQKAELSARTSRAALDTKTNRINEKAAVFDAINTRIENVLDTASSAKNILLPKIPAPAKTSTVRYDRDGNYSGHTERHAP